MALYTNRDESYCDIFFGNGKLTKAAKIVGGEMI